MRTARMLSAALIYIAFHVPVLNGQQSQTPAPKPKPEETELWSPVPRVVTPGSDTNAPPSDAIVLFAGQNLDHWVSSTDKSPAKWTVADSVVTVNKAAGNIETRQKFHDYQLHIEWRVPANVTGSGQARGNSGIFLAATGTADGATSSRSSIPTRTRPT